MINDELNLKIEAYLGDNMSPEEVSVFKKQMENDPSLKNEVKLAKQVNHHLRDDSNSDPVSENEYTREIRSFLQSDEAKTYKKTLLEVKEEYKANAVKTGKRNYFLVAAAVAALIITTAGIIFFNQNNTKDLYAEYYSNSDLPSLIKRSSSNDKLATGVITFKNLNFSEAILNFEAYKNSTTEINPAVYLYEGVSYFQLDKYDAALEEFNKMIASNSLDSSKGLWFKMLTYLKMGDKKMANVVLNEILKDPSNFNYSRALELKKEL
jgi:tetratricopeptide (TPR) repeat protein